MGHSIVQYLGNLQQNDAVARPTNWALVLLDTSLRKKYGLSLAKQDKTKESAQQHIWNYVSFNHYSLADTGLEFQAQMDSGLPLPVLILPDSELGISIGAQHTWLGESLDMLLDNILGKKKLPIEVQDHGLSRLGESTTIKTCDMVRSRFNLSLEDRGCPWNCLEIDDRLPGFKGPKLLENGGSLLRWQVRNPRVTVMNRSAVEPVRGGKFFGPVVSHF